VPLRQEEQEKQVIKIKSSC